MAKKLLGTGTYELVEDEQGRPIVRIRGHILASGEVFETVLDHTSPIVQAVSQSEPVEAPISIDASFA